MNNLSYQVNWNTEKDRFQHLKDLPLYDVNAADIKMIIGVDAYHLQSPLEERKGATGTPMAVRTKLGWVAFSHFPGERDDSLQSYRINTKDAEDREKNVEEHLKQWINMESIPDTSSALKGKILRSVEDTKAQEILQDKTRRIPGENAYEVGVLWRDDDPVLYNNRSAAEAQLKALEYRLNRDPELKKAYQASIENDVMMGYIKKLTSEEEEATKDSQKVNYLTHHPVRNPKKPGKVRRVYNAAAKYNGKSLNDHIYAGPDLLTSLFGVLLRFRQYPITLCSDIKDMFLQMRVTKEDMPALRFLYRESQDQDPDVYQCLRRPFGERSAPACANYVVRKNSKEHEEKFPQAEAAVQRNLYVDDSINSVETIEEAIELYEQLLQVMKLGGFKLTKWLSNSEEVMNKITEAEKAVVKTLAEYSGLPNSRALGITYDAKTDCLYVTPQHKEAATTPRGILSKISSIFDPHGWFSNRRGYPRTVTSDNGANLVGANKELREGWNNLKKEKGLQDLSSHGIEWKFIPPSSPHMNGAAERLVRSCKRALHAILHGQNVKYDTLNTALVEVEGILNSRPITPASTDPQDLEALTPNHILLHKPNLNAAFDVVQDREINSRKSYRKAQVLAQRFWSRWITEYLPMLTNRNKWTNQVRNMQEGDLVIIKDSKTFQRGNWPIGIVLETYPGKDGIVRTAKVSTKTDSYTRPVTKLCLLEEQ